MNIIECSTITEDELKKLIKYNNHESDDYEDIYGFDRYKALDYHLDHCNYCLERFHEILTEEKGI